MKETTYQCPNNKKHKVTVTVPVKEVICGKCPRAVLMKALPPKEAK